MRLHNAAGGELRRGQRFGRLAGVQPDPLVAWCRRARRRAAPVCARAPDGGEENTYNLEEDVEVDDVGDMQHVVLAEGEDDDDDIEDDGEDEVEDGDPEQSLQATRVRACDMAESVDRVINHDRAFYVLRPPLVNTLASPCLPLNAWASFRRRRNSVEAYLVGLQIRSDTPNTER